MHGSGQLPEPIFLEIAEAAPLAGCLVDVICQRLRLVVAAEPPLLEPGQCEPHDLAEDARLGRAAGGVKPEPISIACVPAKGRA